jgi:hypothetical protein
MGWAGGMIRGHFGRHLTLILCPWGRDRLRGMQSLSSVFGFLAHYCVVLPEHYIIRRYEARLVEARVKFGIGYAFVICLFWPRLLPRVVA